MHQRVASLTFNGVEILMWKSINSSPNLIVTNYQSSSTHTIQMSSTCYCVVISMGKQRLQSHYFTFCVIAGFLITNDTDQTKMQWRWIQGTNMMFLHHDARYMPWLYSSRQVIIILLSHSQAAVLSNCQTVRGFNL